MASFARSWNELNGSKKKKATQDDIRDVYAEAKGNGFDVKALRSVIRLRKQDADERREQEAILETYMHALGMLADTPLGAAAVARDLAPAGRVDVSEPPFTPD